MKKMVMALAALCVAGAASAVTAGWSDYQTVGGNKTKAGWSSTIIAPAVKYLEAVKVA